MKQTLKSMRPLAATLITFGSLAGGANAAIIVQIDEMSTQLEVNVTVTTPIGNDFTNLGNSRNVNDPLTYTDSGSSTGSYDLYNWDDLGDPFSNMGNAVYLVDGFEGVSASSSGYGVFFSNDGTNIDDFGVALPSGTSLSSGLSFTLLAPLPTSGFSNFFNDGVYTSGVNSLTVNSIPEPSSALLVGLGTLGFAARRRREHRRNTEGGIS